MNEDRPDNQQPEGNQPEESRVEQNRQEPQQGYIPPPGRPQPGPYYPGPTYTPSQPPTRPPRNLWYLIPISLAVGCLPWLILFVLAMVAIVGSAAGVDSTSDHVALIRVTGPITGGEGSGGFMSEPVAGAESIVEQLEEARKNKRAKAIVIRINSPGGSAAGSEEVYREIMRIRRSGKPVYTSMGDVAASGGYYIAAASDKIYADAGTITGSIGVIFQTADLSELFNKIGLNPETIKSGKFKDIGSPNRPLTPDERQLLQGMVDDIFNQFVRAVADGRKMPVDRVREIADGRVLTGNQALELKLVDKIAGMRETVRDAAKVGGIKGEPSIKEYGRMGMFRSLFGAEDVRSGGIGKALRKAVIDELVRGEGDLSGLR